MKRYVRVAVVLASAPAAMALSAVVGRLEARADCLPFTAVSGTSYETFAIRSDMTVWKYGSLAPPEAGAVPEPVDRVTRISTTNHAVALRDGLVWSWGDNDHGQIGDGDVNHPFPLPVTGAPTSEDVAAGSDHSLALSGTGHVWSWGYGYRGRLGHGNQTSHDSPVQVPGLSDVVDVAAGDEHSLAVRRDGTVVAWGDNFWGQLGDGSHNNYRPSPVNVLRVTGAVAVAGNQTGSLALKSDGTVWEWGDEPNNVAPEGPRQVSGLSGITAIAAGANALHWVALKDDGTVWTWGNNWSGQIGDGTTAYRWTPYRVLGLPAIAGIATGHAHTVALARNGEIWAWGRNTSGQLGDGTSTDRLTPVRAQHVIQCFVPDVASTPTPVPSVSPTPLPAVSPPSGTGGEAPVAECRFVRAQGEIAYGGYALVTNDTPPVATTVTCTVTTGTVYGERTATVPGAVAVVSDTVAAQPAPVRICAHAEAVYADDRVVATSVCRDA